MLADLRPALLWPRPIPCPEASLRCLLSVRADVGVVPLAVGGLEGWPTAEEGARLADMEGEGEERDRAAPLVWMPGGIGRFILVETAPVGVATTVGAIVYGPAAAGGSEVGGRFRMFGIAPNARLRCLQRGSST
jgi:hypothetical protein